MRIMFIGAHPDDAEASAGGTLARLARTGAQVKMLSVTNGDAGHFADKYREDRGRLAVRRRAEAADAAALIGAESGDLGVHDGEVVVDLDLTRRVVREIRLFGLRGGGPDLIITHRPVDYHRDHRYTSRLVLDAAYVLTVPLFCPDTPHLDRDPVIAYHADGFTEGGVFRPDVRVDISDTAETKARMLAAHASQMFEWLPYNGGRLDTIPADPEARLDLMRKRVRSRGEWARGLTENTPLRASSPGDCAISEVFQISEYGRQPGNDELNELFGLL
ncbi:MAG TPA: PIG-L deacetylase family protein [Armatimonadota bacterium]|nr:PIG-L deacetylase family protein [Armatimonadota bacterium]